MTKLRIQDIKVGQHIIFLEPPTNTFVYFNHCQQEYNEQIMYNRSVVGRIFQIEGFDLPFVLLTDILKKQTFTFDVRDNGEMRLVDRSYLRKFKDLFINENPGPGIMIMSTSKSNAGIV